MLTSPQEAVEMYKKIGKPKDGIKMYLSRGKVDEAYKYAETLVKNDELRDIFREEAQNMILAKKYADAEKYERSSIFTHNLLGDYFIAEYS